VYKLILFATAFFLANPTPGNACGYSLLGEDYRIALLNPYIIGEDYAPLFYSANRFHTRRNAKAGTDRLRNASAWAQELGPDVSPKDVMAILYGTSLQDWLKAKKGYAPKTWKENPAWRAIVQRPDLHEYVFYAKGYEQENVFMHWWEEEETPVATGEEIYRENYHARALAGYTKAKTGSFLKDRYAYQLLLLAYYDNDAEAMEAYFMSHFKGKSGALADWARFHFAAQWNEEGRYTVEMANALRAVPEKAIAAYSRTNKRIKPADYLAATRNAAERSNLYALAALKEKGKALSNILKAYELDPTNPLVELLVVREINKLEDWLVTNPLTGLGPAHTSYQMPEWTEDYQSQVDQLRRENMDKDRGYLKQVRKFLKDYRPKNAKRGAIFRGQAALLDEDYRSALKETAALKLGDEGAGLQVRIIRYLALLQGGKLTDEKVQEELAEHLLALDRVLPKRDPNEYYSGSDKDFKLLPVLNRIASQRYASTGDTVTAYLLHNRSLSLLNGNTWSSDYYRKIDYLDRDISPAVMDGIIAFLEGKAYVSAFDGLLRTNLVPEVEVLLDLAGTLALRRNDLPRALAYLDKIPDGWYATNDYFSNDFNSPWSDQEEPYFWTTPITKMIQKGPGEKLTSKVMLLRQLQTLEEQSSQGGDHGAAACLALAQAWYNMSDFGPAWDMLAYGKSSQKPSGPTRWPEGVAHAAVPHNKADFDLIYRASRSEAYFDCAEATAKDQQLLAEIDLSRRILKYRILEAETMAKSWGWLDDDERAVLSREYQSIMSPFVRKYGKTDYAVRVAMQCSKLDF
jgi:hypothetical protein